jgi:hypothetical protein
LFYCFYRNSSDNNPESSKNLDVFWGRCHCGLLYWVLDCELKSSFPEILKLLCVFLMDVLEVFETLASFRKVEDCSKGLSVVDDTLDLQIKFNKFELLLLFEKLLDNAVKLLDEREAPVKSHLSGCIKKIKLLLNRL